MLAKILVQPNLIMNTIQFSAYALSSSGYLPGVTVDHVCVVGDNHDWNCFGRGAGQPPQGNLVAQGMGNALWASKIYGPYESRGPECLAAGVTEKYEGVCHTVANRILVLCGDDVDSRKASGNELATLLYGRFGFNLDAYVARVKQAAVEANNMQSGSVSQEDVDTVVNRITRGFEPHQELELLRADLEEQFQLHFEILTPDQKQDFVDTYTDFQKKRKVAFDAEPKGNTQDFQPRFARRLGPDLMACLLHIQTLLGVDLYLKIFKLTPEAAMAFLLHTA
jgi:hypothetical protein